MTWGENITEEDTKQLQKQLQKLYKERAMYADIESDCQDAKKYTRVNGLGWWLFSWIERKAKKWRLEVQQEIDDLWKDYNP